MTPSTADRDRVFLLLHCAYERERIPQTVREVADLAGQSRHWTRAVLAALVDDGRARVSVFDEGEGCPHIYSPAIDRRDRAENLALRGVA